jgi:hypothetical protein
MTGGAAMVDPCSSAGSRRRRAAEGLGHPYGPTFLCVRPTRPGLSPILDCGLILRKRRGFLQKGRCQPDLVRSRPIRRSVKAGDVASFSGLDISQES